MKKNLFFAALALVALASCSDEQFVNEIKGSPDPGTGPEQAIVFDSGANAITRSDYTGSGAATKLQNNFVVEGVKWDGGSSTQTVVFNNYNVNYVDGSANTTTSNTAGWEYVAQTPHYHGLNTAPKITAQSIKYWDYSKSQYDFIAYSAGTATAEATGDYGTDKVVISAIDATKLNGVDSNSDGKIDQGAYTIAGTAENLAKCYIADLVTAYKSSDYQKTVKFTFRSLSAKVRVALYETVPGYSVKDVEFYTAENTVASDGHAHLYTTGGDVFNEKGTYSVYFPTTGSTNKNDKDYNKAHLVFAPATSGGTATYKDFGAFVYNSSNNTTFADKEVSETSDKIYLGRSSNEATYAGVNTTASPNFYTIVIPNEEGAVLNLKVNYTLVSTDGSGETITVTGAKAQVPSEYTSWKSGYAYTYIFKISQNTNGLTDPNTPVVGLYPITFDAVVTETEEHVQETITTVATPSITTYSKGAIVTANDEYITGQNIYVVVYDGTANVTLTGKAELYTVTQVKGTGAEEDSKPAQSINEESIDNALAHGTGGSGVFTVTDANKWDLTLTKQTDPTITDRIVDADSPTGKEMEIGTNQVAYFNPSSAGIYVFRYVKTAHVAAQPAVYYTKAECNDHNASTFAQALPSGSPLTTTQLNAYNTSMNASKTEGASLTVDEAYAYNETLILSGAWTTSTVKTAAVTEVPGEYYYKIIKVQ